MDTKNQPIHFSVAPLIWRVLIALFLIETGYVLLFAVYLVLRPPLDATALVVVLWIFQTVKFLVLVGFISKIVAAWAGHAAFIGEGWLMLHSGLVQAEDKVYELAQLRSVSLQQGWLGRRFNYGTLELQFGRLGNSLDISLIDVHDPEKYSEMLAKCIGFERSQQLVRA